MECGVSLNVLQLIGESLEIQVEVFKSSEPVYHSHMSLYYQSGVPKDLSQQQQGLPFGREV